MFGATVTEDRVREIIREEIARAAEKRSKDKIWNRAEPKEPEPIASLGRCPTPKCAGTVKLFPGGPRCVALEFSYISTGLISSFVKSGQTLGCGRPLTIVLTQIERRVTPRKGK